LQLDPKDNLEIHVSPWSADALHYIFLNFYSSQT
jgi:hypothetical protein